jgi:hypothetical protein
MHPVLRIRNAVIRIRIPLFTFTDSDPNFHFNVNSDPAPHQSDANLRPLVQKPSRLFYDPWPSIALICASTAPEFRFYADLDPAFDFDAYPPMTRILADPDPLNASMQVRVHVTLNQSFGSALVLLRTGIYRSIPITTIIWRAKNNTDSCDS